MCQKHQKLCHGHWLKKVVVCSPLFSMTLKVIWWKYALTYYTVFGIFHQSLPDQNSKYLHLYILFFSESGFMCMEVYRKADTIMSLKLGRLSRNPEEACNQHLFFDTAIPSVIIVSAKMGHKERCPLVGKYALVNNNIQSITLQEQPGKYNIFGLGTMYFCCCHPFKGLTYFFSWYKNLFIFGILSALEKSVHFAMKNIIKCFCFWKCEKLVCKWDDNGSSRIQVFQFFGTFLRPSLKKFAYCNNNNNVFCNGNLMGSDFKNNEKMPFFQRIQRHVFLANITKTIWCLVVLEREQNSQ